MKKHIPALSIVSALFVLVGCASIEPPYIPQTVGAVGYHLPSEDLDVTIQARRDTTKVGIPIVFDITLQNVSSDAYWVPRDPHVCFHFVYSNGIRDNYLSEAPRASYFEESDAVLLLPGQELSTSFEVKTYYFERTGITEFYAVVDLVQNTNPEIRPWWHGRLESNAYGVMVRPPDNRLNTILFGAAPKAGSSPST